MDHGFVDFVSARWSRLHRLAYLLAGDEVRSTDLLRVALEKTRSRWPRLGSGEEAEGFVRAALVDGLLAPRRRTTARQVVPHDVPPDPPLTDDEPADPSVLWPLVCALPERQRAVLVLLHHEELAPEEAAAVLRSTPGSVRSQARGALGALARGVAASRPPESAGETLVLGADDRTRGEVPPVAEADLRAALRSAAGRHEAPAPDVESLLAGGTARARRRRVVVAAAVAVACLAVVATAVVVVRLDRGGTSAPPDATPLVDRRTQGVVDATGIPWCVRDPDDAGTKRLIVGEGAPIRAWCSWRGPGHPDRWGFLWHHSGSTVLVRSHGVYRVAGGRLVRLGGAASSAPVFSHDGRYVAWLSNQRPGCGSVVLDVYDLATATSVARTAVPARPCAWLDGIDDRGRVFVTGVGSDTSVPLDVWMYGIGAHAWTKVTGIPGQTNGIPLYTTGITYVTADGFAAEVDGRFVGAADTRHAIALASIEGSVDARGRFAYARTTPVGRGFWSAGRSMVAEQRLEGVVVRSVGALTRTVVLDLPVDRFRATADTLPHTNLQWVSLTSLVVSTLDRAEPQVYRCDARSGYCVQVRAAGEPALANRALP